MNVAEIIALITGISGAVVGGLSWIKTRAEAERVNIDAAAEVIALLRGELSELEQRRSRRIAELEKELADLEHRTEKLELWILENTGTPIRDILGPGR